MRRPRERVWEREGFSVQMSGWLGANEGIVWVGMREE
jgi:hypothetical protein